MTSPTMTYLPMFAAMSTSASTPTATRYRTRCNLALTSPKPHRRGRACIPVAPREQTRSSGTNSAAELADHRANGDYAERKLTKLTATGTWTAAESYTHVLGERAEELMEAPLENKLLKDGASRRRKPQHYLHTETLALREPNVTKNCRTDVKPATGTTPSLASLTLVRMPTRPSQSAPCARRGSKYIKRRPLARGVAVHFVAPTYCALCGKYPAVKERRRNVLESALRRPTLGRTRQNVRHMADKPHLISCMIENLEDHDQKRVVR